MHGGQLQTGYFVYYNHLCLRFFYDIYDSPHPAAFRLVLGGPTKAAVPAEPQTLPLSSGSEKTPLSVFSIHITVHSKLLSNSRSQGTKSHG